MFHYTIDLGNYISFDILNSHVVLDNMGRGKFKIKVKNNLNNITFSVIKIKINGTEASYFLNREADIYDLKNGEEKEADFNVLASNTVSGDITLYYYIGSVLYKNETQNIILDKDIGKLIKQYNDLKLSFNYYCGEVLNKYQFADNYTDLSEACDEANTSASSALKDLDYSELSDALNQMKDVIGKIELLQQTTPLQQKSSITLSDLKDELDKAYSSNKISEEQYNEISQEINSLESNGSYTQEDLNNIKQKISMYEQQNIIHHKKTTSGLVLILLFVVLLLVIGGVILFTSIVPDDDEGEEEMEY